MNPVARTARLPVFLLALGLVLAATGGCSNNHAENIRTVLDVNAVAFNDSVAGGDTLFLKVQYLYPTTCEQNAHFEVQALGGSNFLVVPAANHPSDQACTGVNGVGVATLRVLQVGTGTPTFFIEGANDTLVAHVTSSTDTGFVKNRGIVFRIQVLDAFSDLPVPAAHVTILNVDNNSTLADDLADLNGRYAFAEPCGPDLSYVVSVSGNGRTANLVVRMPPARCRLPEAVVIHV